MTARKQSTEEGRHFGTLALRWLGAAALVIGFAGCCAAGGGWLLWRWCQNSPLHAYIIVLVYIQTEAAFSLAWWHKYRKLSCHPKVHAPSHSSYVPGAVFQRFIHSHYRTQNFVCIRTMVRTWFGGMPLSEIKDGNVAELLTYGFWYMTREQYEAAGLGPSTDLVRQLEQAWPGLQFEPGYNPKLSFMAHLWQPVRCQYRPLTVYLGIELLHLLKHVLMMAVGFTRHTHNGCTYYTSGLSLANPSPRSLTGAGIRRQRLASKSSLSLPSAPNCTAVTRCIQCSRSSQPQAVPLAQARQAEQPGRALPADPLRQAGQLGASHTHPLPILFLHGVGVGLLPYTLLLARMAASGHPVLAVECDHLSMRWVDHVPNSDEVVELVRGVCDHHGIKCACVASHSYGTFQASRLLQLHPSYVACLCLIDPVTFLMFTGHLIRNFVYTPWVTGLTTWFISRDIHHAASVCRRFFWSDLNLWPDQLPEHAMVVLCEQDTLLPVQDVVTMLQSEAPHVEVLRHPTHRHAQFLIDLPFQSRIVDSMLHMMAKASTASPPSPKPTGAAAKAAEAAEAVWHLKPERLKSMPTDEPTDGTCCHSGDDTSCGGWVGDVTSLAGTTAIARVHRAGAASPLTQTCKVRR